MSQGRMLDVKVPNVGSARAIPAKGLPTASNGAPYREGAPKIPTNAAKSDRGASVGGTKAPRKRPDEPMKTERKPSLGGQRMREKGKGFSKLKSR